MGDKQRGILFAVLASLMFGLTPVFMRLVLELVNVETMTVLFSVFSSLFFTVFFAFFHKKVRFRSVIRNWRKVALLSLFSATGALLFTYGVFFFGPVTAVFLIQFSAIFTIMFGVVFFKERFTKLEAVGILLALVGVFVLTYGNLALEIVSTLVLLSAALLFASANLLSKVYVKTMSPLVLAGGNSMFMLLFIAAYSVLSGRLETTFNPITFAYSFLGAVTGAFLSYILFFKALEVFEVSKVATIRTMEPFWTAIFSFAILAWIPTANQLAGGALIVIGVVVLSLIKGK